MTGLREKARRILAILLVIALLAAMVISLAASVSHGEALPRDRYHLEIRLIEEQQALRVSQRLDYYNSTGARLDRMMFALYANMFRRESTVMYEDPSAMPLGYAPAGVSFTSVTVDGRDADWGVQGDGEYFLRVACDLEAGESCEIGFEYDVLLSENAAFFGWSDDGWRLSGFYPILCVYNNGTWEGNTPMQHSRYTLTSAADYTVDISLPENYTVACPGEKTVASSDGLSRWHIQADNIREFAFAAGRRWRTYSGVTSSGSEITVYSSSRRGGPRALDHALEAAELYESWFGKLPLGRIDIAQADYCLDRLAFPGLVWLDSGLFSEKDELRWQAAFSLAEQYFGLGAYTDPVADSWLCVSLCEYVTYLYWETTLGRDAFLNRLNARAVDSLMITMPGNLYITSDAALFNQAQYDAVVRDRGAVAMHEVRVAMGREDFLASLAEYFRSAKDRALAQETDLLAAFDSVTGRDWEPFLTDVLFNIGDLALQDLDWYE